MPAVPPPRTPLRPLAEPASILARPSAVWWSRCAWLLFATPLAATVLTHLGSWAPAVVAPLVLTAAITDGGLRALAWALAAGLYLDLVPPASSTPGLTMLPFAASALVASRGRQAWSASSWAPVVIGALMSLAAGVTVVVLRAAAAGVVAVPILDLLGGSVTTAVLCAIVTPRWVRWTRRLQERGRA